MSVTKSVGRGDAPPKKTSRGRQTVLEGADKILIVVDRPTMRRLKRIQEATGESKSAAVRRAIEMYQPAVE